jgi:hypothetical protein
VRVLLLDKVRGASRAVVPAVGAHAARDALMPARRPRWLLLSRVRSLRDSHVCVSNSMRSNCPVCMEYLFDSIRPISVLACGHTIHAVCLSAPEACAARRWWATPCCARSCAGGSMCVR